MTMMMRSLPYLASEPRACSCGATVQSRLSANASSASATAGSVQVFREAPSFGRFLASRGTAMTQPSRSSLAMLMMAIGNPTEAAARQMTASRKLIFFVRKMVVGVA
jgi:hypothetical protein